MTGRDREPRYFAFSSASVLAERGWKYQSGNGKGCTRERPELKPLRNTARAAQLDAANRTRCRPGSHDAAFHLERAGGENPISCPPLRQACASCEQQVWPGSAANIHLCLLGTAPTCLLPARRGSCGGSRGAANRQQLPARPSTATDSPEKNGEEGELPGGLEGAARSPGEPACVLLLCGMEALPPSSRQPEQCRSSEKPPLPHGVGALPPLWGSLPPRCSQHHPGLGTALLPGCLQMPRAWITSMGCTVNPIPESSVELSGHGWTLIEL